MGVCIYTQSLCDIHNKNLYINNHNFHNYQESQYNPQHKPPSTDTPKKLSILSKKQLNSLIIGSSSLKNHQKRSATFTKSKNPNRTRALYRSKTKKELREEESFSKKKTPSNKNPPTKNDTHTSQEITNLRRLTIPEQGLSSITKSILIHQEINAIIIGDKNVGKTMFVLKVLGKLFEKVYVPSIGLEIKNKMIRFNDLNYNLKLNVIPGEDSYKEDYTYVYESAQFVLLFYDISMENSFSKAKEILLNEIEKYKQVLDKKSIDVIVVGNKMDLGKVNRQNNEVKMFCEEQNWENVELSVKTGTGIKNLLNKLCIKAQRNQLMFGND